MNIASFVFVKKPFNLMLGKPRYVRAIKAGGFPCDGKVFFKWIPFSRRRKSLGKFCRPR
jgi:hypothetical protein